MPTNKIEFLHCSWMPQLVSDVVVYTHVCPDSYYAWAHVHVCVFLGPGTLTVDFWPPKYNQFITESKVTVESSANVQGIPPKCSLDIPFTRTDYIKNVDLIIIIQIILLSQSFLSFELWVQPLLPFAGQKPVIAAIAFNNHTVYYSQYSPCLIDREEITARKMHVFVQAYITMERGWWSINNAAVRINNVFPESYSPVCGVWFGQQGRGSTSSAHW